jgi:DNA-binding response OmpR family regulator
MECRTVGPPMSTATTSTSISSTRVRSANLELWLDEQQAWVDRRRVELTRFQFALLVALLRREQRVCSRELIYAVVWGAPMPRGNRIVDTHVSRLRRRLAAAAPQWRYIHTLRPLGYRFDPYRFDEDRKSFIGAGDR